MSDDNGKTQDADPRDKRQPREDKNERPERLEEAPALGQKEACYELDEDSREAQDPFESNSDDADKTE